MCFPRHFQQVNELRCERIKKVEKRSSLYPVIAVIHLSKMIAGNLDQLLGQYEKALISPRRRSICFSCCLLRLGICDGSVMADSDVKKKTLVLLLLSVLCCFNSLKKASMSRACNLMMASFFGIISSRSVMGKTFDAQHEVLVISPGMVRTRPSARDHCRGSFLCYAVRIVYP